MSPHIIFLIDIRPITEKCSKQFSLIFYESKGFTRIYTEFLITLSIKEQWRYSKELFKFSWTSAKNLKKEKYNLKDFFNDFVIYYNDKEHSNTKVASFRAIMNYENKDLIHKIRENTIKRRQKRRYFICFFDKQYCKSI